MALYVSSATTRTEFILGDWNFLNHWRKCPICKWNSPFIVILNKIENFLLLFKLLNEWMKKRIESQLDLKIDQNRWQWELMAFGDKNLCVCFGQKNWIHFRFVCKTIIVQVRGRSNNKIFHFSTHHHQHGCDKYSSTLKPEKIQKVYFQSLDS